MIISFLFVDDMFCQKTLTLRIAYQISLYIQKLEDHTKIMDQILGLYRIRISGLFISGIRIDIWFHLPDIRVVGYPDELLNKLCEL